MFSKSSRQNKSKQTLMIKKIIKNKKSQKKTTKKSRPNWRKSLTSKLVGVSQINNN